MAKNISITCLKPQLRPQAAEQLADGGTSGEKVVLVGQLLESVLRPLAAHFGVDYFIANRLEFRDGQATGRLVDPIVRPRGPFAWLAGGATNGRIAQEQLLRRLGWTHDPQKLLTQRSVYHRPASDAGGQSRGDVRRRAARATSCRCAKRWRASAIFC